MGKGLAALLALAVMTLAGCEEPPTEPAKSPFFNQGSSALRIENLVFESKSLVGDERFEVSFDIPEAGSQLIPRYGLKGLGVEKLYDVKPALAIVNNGRARMWVGPVPNTKVGGKQTLEFWILDDQGRESNRLTGEITIQ